MTDAPPTLDYAVPRPGRLWPAAAACVWRVPAVLNPVCGVLSCKAVVALSHAHDGSFGGCGNGRLHVEDVLLFGVVPTCTVVLSMAMPMTAGPAALRLARLGTLAAASAYAVLWLDYLDVLAFLKFDVLRMR